MPKKSTFRETPFCQHSSLLPEPTKIREHLVPQGGSQKSKVKNQKAYSIGFSLILNGLFIYADLY
ncbi:MAG: hypothetical protein EA343_23450 [Nodularia sp. (in: Bacteria)]|nr:MAG: hypothetical protein EA343_23450 [Nodularia sp. (in: cyanobacteria)]